MAALLSLSLVPRLAFCRPLRVVSYNIWGLPSPLLRHSERFKELPAAINSLSADVILIQEAFNHDSRALTRLPNFPYHVWGPSSAFLRFNSGLLILSRYPIADAWTIVYSQCGGFDCFANKGALLARIQVPDVGLVNVFDTHLNANGHKRVRRTQVTELARFVRAHADGLPSVVGGDFNGDTPFFLQLLAGTLFVHNAHAEFVDHQTVLTREEFDGFTADPQRNPYLSRSETQRRLDHVFLLDGSQKSRRNPRDGWAVLDASMIFNGSNGKVLSDHFGVRIVADLVRAARAPVGVSERNPRGRPERRP